MDQELNPTGAVKNDGTPNMVTPPGQIGESVAFKPPASTGGMDPKPVMPAPGAAAAPESDLGTVAPEMKNTGEAVFDASEPAFKPDTNMSGGSFEPVGESKHHTVLWIVVAIIVVAVLVLGYLFIYPLFKKSPEPVVETTEPPTTEVEVPNVETPVYSSLFITTPSARVTPSIASPITKESLWSALVNEAGNAGMGVTEIVVSDGVNTEVGSMIFGLLAEQTDTTITSWLTGPVTTFIYKDTEGAWPGYVFRVSEVMSAENLTTLFSAIEASPIANFFVVDPGAMNEFNDGEVFGVADRYATFETPGASFGYLVEGDTLLISTSFAGMKEAMRLLNLGEIPSTE